MTSPDFVTVATARGFERVWPAQKAACRRLWDYVGRRDEGVLLEVARDAEADLCGKLRGPRGRSRFGVLARIERETGPGGAFLLRDGASVREVDAVAKKLARARQRYQDARFGVVGDDDGELERVIERLEERLETRAPMETGFDEEWVPKALVDRVVEHDPDQKRRVDRPSDAGRQASLEEQS